MAKTTPRVAVIGAGISGVVSGAHLKRAGADVTVYERSPAAGGVWLFDERTSIEPDYAEKRPSKGDNFFSSEHLTAQATEEIVNRVELLHAPPGPCYAGLTNNVSTRLLQTTIFPFPEGTPDWVSHSTLGNYIQNLSLSAGLDNDTRYRTRVEDVVKRNGVWEVRSSSFERISDKRGFRLVESTSEFDHVVVASGHYHAPVIPSLPGLEALKLEWPGRVFHSKNYRYPNSFQDKKVLLIGAGVSSVDIAKEISPFTAQIYQASRSGDFDLPAAALPENAVRVAQVSSFIITGSRQAEAGETGALPVTVRLESGQHICDLDYIILCTGYTFSLPFLSGYHNDVTSFKDANDTVLVTREGRQIHNLHKDIFYIPDPTLMFVGIPFYTATFSLFDYQAIAVAAVVGGQAALPSAAEMRREYLQRVADKGFDRHFHSLKGQEETYVGEILAWLNTYTERAGRQPIAGYSQIWRDAKTEQMKRFEAILNGSTAVPVAPWVSQACG